MPPLGQWGICRHHTCSLSLPDTAPRPGGCPACWIWRKLFPLTALKRAAMRPLWLLSLLGLFILYFCAIEARDGGIFAESRKSRAQLPAAHQFISFKFSPPGQESTKPVAPSTLASEALQTYFLMNWLCIPPEKPCFCSFLSLLLACGELLPQSPRSWQPSARCSCTRARQHPAAASSTLGLHFPRHEGTVAACDLDDWVNILARSSFTRGWICLLTIAAAGAFSKRNVDLSHSKGSYKLQFCRFLRAMHYLLLFFLMSMCNIRKSTSKWLGRSFLTPDVKWCFCEHVYVH